MIWLKRFGQALRLTLKLLVIPLFAAAAFVTIMGFTSYTKYLNMLSLVNNDTIYKNIRINSVDVGKLSKTEALNKLNSIFQTELDNKTITLKGISNGSDIEYSYRFNEFDAKLDFTPAIEQAYSYARDGTLAERYDRIMALEDTPYEITYEPKYSYDDSSAQDKVGLIADKVYIAPQNATIDRIDGQFIITKEITGKELDATATTAVVKQLLAQNKAGVVDVILRDVEPEIKEDYVAQAESLIGTFHTTFSAGQNGRNTNILNAARKVNGQTVQPGEVFSTNAALGPSTEENGYAKAPVIVNGKLEEDLGGGVCQVSSTLYNAILRAELEVVERTNHSLKVGYLDYSFDATLAGDYLDLKFKNNTDLPVFLECYVDGNHLVANIYGKEIHDSGRTLKFYNQLLSRIDPSGEIVTYDPNLPRGERVVSKAASEGYKYALYKDVYEDGAKVSTEWINNSTYKARPAEVTIGTGAIPEPKVNAAVSTAAENKPAQETANTSSNASPSEPAYTEPAYTELAPAVEPAPAAEPVTTETEQAAEPVVTESE